MTSDLLKLESLSWSCSRFWLVRYFAKYCSVLEEPEELLPTEVTLRSETKV